MWYPSKQCIKHVNSDFNFVTTSPKRSYFPRGALPIWLPSLWQRHGIATPLTKEFRNKTSFYMLGLNIFKQHSLPTSSFSYIYATKKKNPKNQPPKKISCMFLYKIKLHFWLTSELFHFYINI